MSHGDWDRSRLQAGSGIPDPGFHPLCAAGPSEEREESSACLPFPGSHPSCQQALQWRTSGFSPGAGTRAGIRSLRSWLGDGKGNPRTLAGCCWSTWSSALRGFWGVCSSFHGFAFICWRAAAAPEDTAGSGNFLHGDQGSGSPSPPMFPLSKWKRKFPLLPFLAFLSRKLAQPLLQHPPQSSSHSQGLPKAALAVPLPLGMLCAAFPQSLPASLHHPFATRKSLCLIMH